jgi:hypothetical protein
MIAVYVLYSTRSLLATPKTDAALIPNHMLHAVFRLVGKKSIAQNRTAKRGKIMAQAWPVFGVPKADEPQAPFMSTFGVPILQPKVVRRADDSM